MKTSLFSYLVAGLLFRAASLTLVAQEPVTTGIIDSVNPRAGEMTMRSDRSGRPHSFYGLNRANIFHVDGQPAVLSELEPGHHVTIEYAERRGRWYISKVMLNRERPGPAPIVPTRMTRPAPLIYTGP